MITLRRTMVWIAAAVLCLGFGTVATAGYIDYVYDFDNGQVIGGPNPGITLNGQDNWHNLMPGPPPVRPLEVRNDLGSNSGIEGLAASQINEGTGYSARVNDINFGYSIPAGTEFSLEFNTLVGPANTFGLAVDLDEDGVVAFTNELAFQFGVANGGWYIRQVMWGTEIVSSQSPAAGEMWRIVLDVNPAGHAGDGAGSMSVQLLSGAGGVLTPVSDMQGVNLGMLNLAEPDPSKWDALYITLSDGCAADNLTVTAIPEPGTGLLLILGLAGFGLFLRRR